MKYTIDECATRFSDSYGYVCIGITEKQHEILCKYFARLSNYRKGYNSYLLCGPGLGNEFIYDSKYKKITINEILLPELITTDCEIY